MKNLHNTRDAALKERSAHHEQALAALKAASGARVNARLRQQQVKSAAAGTAGGGGGGASSTLA